MGRPPQAVVKGEWLGIRVTPEKHLEAIQMMRAEGYKTKTAFIEARIFDGRKEKKKPSVAQVDLDPRLWFQIRKIGVNLNQIAHALNASPHPFVPHDLEPLLAELRQLLVQNFPEKKRRKTPLP